MTNILAIDTSTSACSVAIQCGDETLTRHKLANREHTKLLLPMVDDLLSESGKGLSQIDAIAFTAGPGSFTGIRIGFGVVQGLAFGADLPVLPVSSIETLAYTAIRKLSLSFDESSSIEIIPMFDARMDEVYWAHFQLSGQQGANVLQRVCKDSLSAPEKITPAVSENRTVHNNSGINENALINGTTELIVVGDGWNYGDRIDLEPTTVDSEMLPEAQDILTYAIPLIQSGKAIPIEQASPVYLRDKITWKKRERLR